MHPIFFQIGPITVYTYGVFVAIGFLLGLVVAVREARRTGEDPQKIMDMALYVLIGAIVGSRGLYVLISREEFTGNPFQVLFIWKGGLVFYGGLVGGILVVIWYTRRYGMALLKTLDIYAPAMALGHAVGRIGCFSAGCCYGRPTPLPWAVTFTHPASLAPLGLPLHPVQLYECFSLFLIFALLMKLRRWQSFNGQLAWTYLFLYASARFILEFFRGDPRGFLFDGALSTSQFLGVLVAPVAAFFWWRGWRKVHKGSIQ
jgi:phosphatidylglycerol:prolipoprotein diacylglycerol transferase